MGDLTGGTIRGLRLGYFGWDLPTGYFGMAPRRSPDPTQAGSSQGISLGNFGRDLPPRILWDIPPESPDPTDLKCDLLPHSALEPLEILHKTSREAPEVPSGPLLELEHQPPLRPRRAPTTSRVEEHESSGAADRRFHLV